MYKYTNLTLGWYRWPALLPAITTNLQSSNILHMSNALLILRKVVKRFEFRQK